ncbi:MAG: DUF885 domain-containing protein [Eubacterium sp.]|jgi:uncharacterized protein (DUF885 family)|nr:DUF885 domain-containing protein [Eubacterium sp.]
MKKAFKKTVAFLLATAAMLSLNAYGSAFAADQNTANISSGLTQSEFDAQMFYEFMDTISNDPIYLNNILTDPEKYGVQRETPTFGNVRNSKTYQNIRKSQLEYSKFIKKFNYEDLRPDQQVVYDTLIRSIEIDKTLYAKNEYAYYQSMVKPGGIHVSLPITLAEFNFYTDKDIEVYMALLEDFSRYFTDIIVFERARAKKGFGMSKTNIEKITKECEDFLKETDDNILIKVFDDKINAFKGLSKEKRSQYKQKNRLLVEEEIFPAYTKLANSIRGLRQNAPEITSLAAFPDGKAYAAARLRDITGSDKTPKEIDKLFRDKINEINAAIDDILKNNLTVSFKYYYGLFDIKKETQKKYLENLEKSIENDFPKLGSVNYEVKQVQKNLQESSSPAFFIVPPIDSFNDNIIYTNPIYNITNLETFTTLAHEGFPGHLYQTVYFRKSSPKPIRFLLEPLGYSEGWAEYAKIQSLNYTGLEEIDIEFLKLIEEYNLLVDGVLDNGVNALGWDLDETIKHCKEIFGTNSRNKNEIQSIYQSLCARPLSSLPYSLGYMEMLSLHDEAEKALGENFKPIEFHRFILDFGPAPFEIIRESMRNWIDGQKSASKAAA